MPFLRPEHCKDGEGFALTGYNRKDERATGREQIKLEIENNAELRFDLGVRLDSPDYRKLHMALGSDWRTWNDAMIYVKLAEGREKDGPRFVNIDRVEPISRR